MCILLHQGPSHMDRLSVDKQTPHHWEKSLNTADFRPPIFVICPHGFILVAQCWIPILKLIPASTLLLRFPQGTGACLGLAPARGWNRLNILHNRDWDYKTRGHVLPVRRPHVPQCPLEATATAGDPCGAAVSQGNLLRCSPLPSVVSGMSPAKGVRCQRESLLRAHQPQRQVLTSHFKKQSLL